MPTEFKTPFMIMMVGLPGSGKSTIRGTLKDALPEFEVASTDDIIDELCEEAGLTYSEGFDRFIGKATSIFNNHVSQVAKTEKNIIFDRTNMTEKSRKKFLDKFRDTHNCYAVVCKVSEEELTRRLDERAQKTGKSIPAKVIQSMSEGYVEPTTDEGFIEVVVIGE